MPTTGKSPVIPTMRYEDARAAIRWLCENKCPPEKER